MTAESKNASPLKEEGGIVRYSALNRALTGSGYWSVEGRDD
jgi:hypothetical protein